jgi:hypothetical protein
MNVFKAITKAMSGVTGGFIDKAVDLVTGYIPDPAAKAEIKAKLQALELEREKAINEAIHVAAEDLNSRIAEQEGTAKDLMSLPFVGRVIIFARGAQRPIWGYATLYFDWQLFANELALSEQQTQLLWIINFLVLGFLFGERAVKNIMPLVVKMMEAKKS